MGWIKAHLDEATHETLRREADRSDCRVDEVATALLRERVETIDTFSDVVYEGVEADDAP